MDEQPASQPPVNSGGQVELNWIDQKRRAADSDWKGIRKYQAVTVSIRHVTWQ